MPSGHGTIWVRRQNWPGSIPNRVDLPQKNPTVGTREFGYQLAHLISIPPLMITLICHSRRHRRFSDTQKVIHLQRADSSASEMVGNTSFHPSSEPTLSRVFSRTFPTVLRKLHRDKSDLDQKACSTNESHTLNIREEKKGPAEHTRERSTPAPPEAEVLSGRHLKVEQHQ